MPNWTPRQTLRARRLRREASPAERALWAHLCRSQLGAKFSRQMPVGPYFADFLSRALKLVIELDGHSHDLQPERDVKRDAWFTEKGYRVLRFTNEQVKRDAQAVARAIQTEVDSILADRGKAHP